VRVRDILAAAAGHLGLGQPLEMGQLWTHWRDVVGTTIADHVEPSSLRERILRVRADSPVWATEVAYLRDRIRRRANDVLGDEVVDDVRVWTGPGRIRSGQAAPPPPPPAPARGAPKDAGEAFQRARAAWVARRARGRWSDRGDAPEAAGQRRQGGKKPC
jgi:hypothetical protein